MKPWRSLAASYSAFSERSPWERASAIAAMTPVVDAHVAGARFEPALVALAGVRGAVDAFFDKVLVNAEDLAVRANRLALLTGLEKLLNRVADISRLAA